MGLFDFFTREGKLTRHARRMGDRDAQQEDREVSASWLYEDGSRQAIEGLLRRFEFSMTQQIKDQGEKERVYQLLKALGDDVVEPVKDWLRAGKEYAWPLRLLAELQGDQAAIDLVFELLDAERKKAGFHPERKRELLVWLAEHRHPEALGHAVPFLEDFDESVRVAATEVVVAQNDDAARAPLLARLADPEEESNRMKHRICEAFQARAWPVDDADLDGVLPPGFAVHGGRIVAA